MTIPVQDRLALDPALIKNLLVRFLYNESSRVGVTKAVIGLSGELIRR